MAKAPFSEYFVQRFNQFRRSLAYIDALPQLTLLGFIVGALTGILIVIFRFLIDIPLTWLLPDHVENFEALSGTLRVLLVLAGALALGLSLHLINKKHRDIGLSHVLDRMHNHQGLLPWPNWLVQFFGAIIAMISGQSAGREGPVVHIGAGAASLMGQTLKLPNNSIHTLVGCGVAAAISASFDTPMAGVIFAMEVIRLQYTIVGFVPVILASVIGTIINQAALGHSSFISIGETTIASLAELPFMVTVGVVTALCAGVYLKLHIAALKLSHLPVLLRLSIAGGITAVAAFFVPQIMGLGYDTVNLALSGTLLSTLLIIAVVKLCVTPVVIGLGIPGGVIGPLLVIGACVGGAIGGIASALFPSLGAHAGFYVMMGMAGMMAAVLNAPLTALVTVLELTYNPNIIFPAMLVIVVACVVTRQVFKLKGIFVEQLIAKDHSLDFGPAKQSLLRAGVSSVMDTRFVILPCETTPADAKAKLAHQPIWVILCDNGTHYPHAIRAADLAIYLEEHTDAEPAPIDLLEIPGKHFRLSPIHESASLFDAWQSFETQETEMLSVSGYGHALQGGVQGILTLDSIENYYKP